MWVSLMNTNVYRPFNVHECEGYEYFIIFTNDYSKYG